MIPFSIFVPRYQLMLEEFKKYIEENNLVENSHRVLLAVSGGMDSMVMTHLFQRTATGIGIAHCNFNLRGSESDEDESFVNKFASDFNIPFYSESFDTTGFASEKNISIQMAARELRYRWFEEIRAKNNFNSVALAHNLNDNIETFFINLTRGTGIAGLTGMKPKYKSLIRPILFASRQVIAEYCDHHKVPFREDRSNAETKYIRNKIRHSILPVFREINPSFDTTVSETAERFGEINEIVSTFITGIRNQVTLQSNNLIVFRIDRLNNLSPKRTILFELFKPFGISNHQLDDLVNLIEGKTGGQIFTLTHRLIKNRKEILVSQRDTADEGYFKISDLEDFKKVPGFVSAYLTKKTGNLKIPSSSNYACLDAGKVIFPLIIRRWMPGDTFYPLGMKRKKKLSDYFIDNKYSILDKENCHILESDGKIVWITGDRIDNRFRITKLTKKMLIIEVKT
jgi:tRNA(Ile)-lysidine synthase